MSEPAGGVPVNIQTNSVELGMTAKVISGADGKPKTVILSGPHGSEIKMPGEAFPFAINGHGVLAIVSVVQVTAQIGPVANKIIQPGRPS